MTNNITYDELINLNTNELHSLRQQIATQKELTDGDMQLISNIDAIFRNQPQQIATQKEFNLDDFKIEYANLISQEGGRRIRTIYGKEYSPEAWTNKGQNLQDIRLNCIQQSLLAIQISPEQLVEVRKADMLIKRKNDFVNTIKLLEAQVFACNDLLEIRSIKIYEDSTWSHIENYNI